MKNGTTQLERIMRRVIKEKCEGENYCSFPLHPKEYAHNGFISAAYIVKIGYYCIKNNGELGHLQTFSDIFSHESNYKSYISCGNSFNTIRRNAKCCSLSETFKGVVCGTVTCGLLEIVSNIFPITKYLNISSPF